MRKHRDTAPLGVKDAASGAHALPLSCSDCGQNFLSRPALDRHCSGQHTCQEDRGSRGGKSNRGQGAAPKSVTRKHHKPLNLEHLRCQKCGQHFESKSALGHHEESCHSGNHSCNVCHRDFATAKILRCHLQTHVKSCVCKVCGKSFTNNYSLKNHMRNHTGEHPYLCDKCPRVFKSAAQLRCHRQVLHNAKLHVPEESSLVEYEDTPTGIKVKFSCKSCLKVFTSITAFKIHERYHAKDEKLTCKICSRVLGHTGSLKSHMKIHRNERAFVCEFCGKGFIENSELRRHRLIHTGEKPHRCKICGRGFTQSYSLKNHQRTHIAGTASYCQSCRRNFRSVAALQKHKCVPVQETLSSDCKGGTSGEHAAMQSSEDSSTQGDIQGLQAVFVGGQRLESQSGFHAATTSAVLHRSMCRSYELLQSTCAEGKTAAPVSSCSAVTGGQTSSADTQSVASLACDCHATPPQQQGSPDSCLSASKPAKLFKEQTASFSPWAPTFPAFNPTSRHAATCSLAPSHPPVPTPSTDSALPPVYKPHGTFSLRCQVQSMTESPSQGATPPDTDPSSPKTESPSQGATPPDTDPSSPESPSQGATPPDTDLSSPQPLLKQLLSTLNSTLPEQVAMATTQAMAKTVPEAVRLVVGEAGRLAPAERRPGQLDALQRRAVEVLVQTVTRHTLDSVAQQLPPLLSLALMEQLAP